MGRAKKRVRLLPQEFGEEDNLSRLPDELIHKILSFVDAKEAVQTSILSRRWECIWTSLPFLSFGRYQNLAPRNVSRFMRLFLSNRNHESCICDLNLRVYNKGFSRSLVEKYVAHAISHNVQSLTLMLSDYSKLCYKLSMFSSMSMKKLTLEVTPGEFGLKSDKWYLPALTTLRLISSGYYLISILSDSWFTDLPALTTLCLENWNLSSFSFSLPGLTTLRLFKCTFPTTVWDLSDLLTLQLHGVRLPVDTSNIFSALVNLKNLTLYLESHRQNHFIYCPPKLLNLSIGGSIYAYTSGTIVVSTQKLCNFTSFGIFLASIGVPELENVNIRLHDWFGDKDLTCRKEYSWRLTNMLPGFGNAKNLTFDLDSIQALNEISNLLVSLPSPFYKLKNVKLPRGVKESSISIALKNYLLGASPQATIATELPQNMLPQTMAVSVIDQTAVLQEPSTTLTKKLDESQYIHQTSGVHTVNMNVQERHTMVNSVFKAHVVEDSVEDADRVRHDASVAEIDKDRVSSSTQNRDFGLWRGHEVNSKFICLLDHIIHKYPETFEHFTAKNKNLCTINLNMLCTLLNDFTRISLTEVDSEMILEYRDVFAYLQNRGFNVNWAVSHLNYIEHIRFSKPFISELHAIDCRIDDDKIKLQELQALVDDVKIQVQDIQDLQARVDDAKSKLQALQTLRVKKLTEIEDAFGTRGTKLAVGFIGDDLLS